MGDEFGGDDDEMDDSEEDDELEMEIERDARVRFVSLFSSSSSTTYL
jgi:hypothetical protein